MKEESRHREIDPELEARIAALVLGEASDFERDQLSRLIEERPELATLMEQIRSMHGLLRDVGTGEWVAEDDDWKLSAEKRSAVLDLISGEAKEQSANPFVNKSVERRSPVKRNWLWNLTKVAAVFCVVGFFGNLFIAKVYHARSVDSAVTKQLGLATLNYHASASTGVMNRSDPMAGVTDSYAEFEDGATSAGVDLRLTEPAGANELYFDQSLRSALSDIRDSLGVAGSLPSPDYLTDDVQSFSAGPEFNPPQEVTATREVRTAETQNPASTKASSGREPPQPTPDSGLREYRGIVAGDPVESAAPVGPRTRFGVEEKPSLGGQTQGLPRKETAIPGLGTQPVVKGTPTSPLDVPAADFGFQEAGQRSAEGANVDFTEKLLEDSQAVGEDADGDGIVSFGQSMGGGGFGGDGNLIAGELNQEISAEPKPEEIARPVFGGMLSNGELKEAAPSQRIWADLDLQKEKGRMDSSPGVLDGRDFEASRPTHSITSPADEAPSPTDRPAVWSVQPRRAVGAGRTEPESHWHDDSRAKDALAEISELNDVNNGPVTNWGFDQKKTTGQSESRPRSRFATEGQADWHGYVPPMLADKSESVTKGAVKKAAAPSGLNEQNALDEAFSTFSLHVSDVSFKLAQAALAQGEWPEAAKIRIEEFVNAFDYGDPMPSQSEKVACRVEQSIHPFLQQRNLLRVSMRTAAAGRSSNTPLRLTLLLDNSGSMERIDRQQTVRRAFALLAQQLKPIDQVTLISFARQPRLLADKVSGAQSDQLVGLVDNLPSEGGTNIEAALQLAFEKAQEQQAGDAQNRIILLTDGAVNLGDADPESLSRMITTMRDAGIAFDAAGISAEGLNDEILEALTRQGDGRYYLLDSVEAADDGFARQIAGALRPSAKNVKVQVEFNPKRVGRYKLLGFEKHRLKQEDFRNDQVDAAEMAAAEAGVAVYQFEAKPDGEGDVGSVSVRFRDLSTGQMIEDRWPIPYEADAPRCEQAAPSLRVATAAALLAAKLRGEPLGESVVLETLSDLIAGLPDRDRNAKRVGQLQMMIGQARQVSGE